MHARFSKLFSRIELVSVLNLLGFRALEGLVKHYGTLLSWWWLRPNQALNMYANNLPIAS